MKYFIKSLILFSLFTSFTYILMVCLWGDYTGYKLKKNLIYEIGVTGHTYSRLKEAKEVKNVDILFLGASNSFRSFDSRIFQNAGYKTFNLGTNAQTPLQTKVLLNRYLNRINPKIIIYSVAPVLLSIDGVESSLDVFANDRNDLESVKLALKQNNIKVYNTLIYAFYNEMLNRNNNFSESIKHGYDTYIEGGFVENKTHYSAANKKNEVYYIPFIDKQIKCFENNISMIKKLNFRLIIVYPPNNRFNYKTYTKNDAFDSIMVANAEYYNFNEILELDDSLHFMDNIHLNQNGVELFNKKLIEMLKAENQL